MKQNIFVIIGAFELARSDCTVVRVNAYQYGKIRLSMKKKWLPKHSVTAAVVPG